MGPSSGRGAGADLAGMVWKEGLGPRPSLAPLRQRDAMRIIRLPRPERGESVSLDLGAGDEAVVILVEVHVPVRPHENEGQQELSSANAPLGRFASGTWTGSSLFVGARVPAKRRRR